MHFDLILKLLNILDICNRFPDRLYTALNMLLFMFQLQWKGMKYVAST